MKNDYSIDVISTLFLIATILVITIGTFALISVIKDEKNNAVKCAEKVEKGEYKTMANCLMLED